MSFISLGNQCMYFKNLLQQFVKKTFIFRIKRGYSDICLRDGPRKCSEVVTKQQNSEAEKNESEHCGVVRYVPV